MPQKAISTFQSDIARAEALLDNAASMPDGAPLQTLLKTDIMRAAWMFAVGAMDAYFCDAYTDLIASTFICKSRESAKPLPIQIQKLLIPASVVLAPRRARDNWRWRMAARRMMEDQNALKIETIQKWFKPFFAGNQRFFLDVMPVWSQRSGATARVFGVTSAQYLTAQAANAKAAADNARAAFESRFEKIVQRRHDCIHNCDRPGNTPRPIRSAGTVRNVITDIKFIVDCSDAHIDAQFSWWLRTHVGFLAATATTVGY
jgi:hypothetical protein